MREVPPNLPPAVRITVDFVPDRDQRQLWFVVTTQSAWTPPRRVTYDVAGLPVSYRVEGEWLDILSGVLGSALVQAAVGKLPDWTIAPWPELTEEEETSS